MNKRYFLLLLFSLFFLSGFTQNFQIFKSGYDFYYKNSSGNLMPIRWDDVQISASDTTFFSFKSVRDTSGFQYCVDTLGGSILGKKAIKSITNKVSFINFQNDSIFFFPDAIINDSWSLYNFSDGSYIEVKMTSLITDSVFNNLDTIKIFTLQKNDIFGNIISSSFNNKQISLGKNNGFIQMFDFYLFPNDEQIYTLAGENWPDVGNHNIYHRQVYDFQPGDEFHIDFANVNNMQGATSTYIQTIKKCLSRTDDHCGNSVAYLWEECKKTVISINNPFSITTTFQNDTIQDSIHFANLDFLRFDHIPTEYFLDSSNTNLSPNILTTSSLYHGRTIKSLLDIQYWSDGNCWSGAMVDPGPPYYDYIEGCGGPYYSSMPWILGNYSKNVLVYYKKGNEIWGAPLASDCNALGVDDFLDKNIEVSVFPNPASNKLNFRIDKFLSKDKIEIKIFDFTGKSLIALSSDNNQIEIGIETLPAGLYFYSLSIGDKLIKSDKIVIVR